MKEMSFSRGLKGKADKLWEDGYNHPFVQELGRGTLPKDSFQFYLLQDYRYLLSYAKVFALGALKADTEELMIRFTAMQRAALGEMDLHRQYMADFGVTAEQIQKVKPSLFSQAYTANMLTAGQLGGCAEIIAAVFPCAWSYADYGKRLKEAYADNLAENYYRSWIETYADAAFSASFEWMYDALDDLCQEKNKKELQRLEEIFISSIEFEYLFWDMAYKKEMSFNR